MGRLSPSGENGQSRYDHGDVLAVPGLKNDGTQISVEFTIAQVQDGGGQPAVLVAIMLDVTRRFEEVRALKKLLREAREV